MISSEVERTLVKSPPELWAELSDPETLAKHLGELGEIKITRTEPEKLVEWEATSTTGTVAIKPSGWGTKVTLSVSRELPAVTSEEEEGVEEIPGVSAPNEQVVDTMTAAERFAPDFQPSLRDERPQEPDVVPIPDPDPDSTSKPAGAEPEATLPREEIAPRLGFFARLFGRSRKRAVQPIETTPVQMISVPEQQADPPPVEEAIAPDPVADIEVPSAAAAAEIDTSAPCDEEEIPAAPDLASELRSAEEATAEVTAMLTAVLDRLGAAHHRPFSRS